jgi:hypothetical protein
MDAKAPSSTAVTLTGTQTLTNKTLTNPVIASVVNNTLTTTTGDMIYASAANTPARLGIGSTDQILKVTGGIPAWSTPSSGVLTWTKRMVATEALNQIAYNGTNLYVAAGNGGYLYTSPDGKTWTSRTSGFSTNAIKDVAFGNGLWVAVGQNGTITTSTDGTTWTARTSNMSTNYINAVVYDNSLWVAVGAGGGTINTGGIIYSSDGITWTRKSQSLGTIGSTYNTVVWNGTNWIVGATASTTNYAYATTPSGTWTQDTTTGINDIGQIYWDGTRSIFVENNQVMYSATTTLASNLNYYGLAAQASNETTKSFWKYYNNVVYRFSLLLTSFIPESTQTPAMGTPSFLPYTNNSSGNAMNGASNSAAFVGAVGFICSDGNGRLYTSF